MDYESRTRDSEPAESTQELVPTRGMCNTRCILLPHFWIICGRNISRIEHSGSSSIPAHHCGNDCGGGYWWILPKRTTGVRHCPLRQRLRPSVLMILCLLYQSAHIFRISDCNWPHSDDVAYPFEGAIWEVTGDIFLIAGLDTYWNFDDTQLVFRPIGNAWLSLGMSARPSNVPHRRHPRWTCAMHSHGSDMEPARKRGK